MAMRAANQIASRLLAQMCKRIALSDCRQLSANDGEAYQMQAGLNELQKALAEAGYSPR